MLVASCLLQVRKIAHKALYLFAFNQEPATGNCCSSALPSYLLTFLTSYLPLFALCVLCGKSFSPAILSLLPSYLLTFSSFSLLTFLPSYLLVFSPSHLLSLLSVLSVPSVVISSSYLLIFLTSDLPVLPPPRMGNPEFFDLVVEHPGREPQLLRGIFLDP